MSAVLRHAEVKAIFNNANLIRNSSESLYQAAEAERQILMAMYKFALGQITQEEKQQILDVLRPCCPEIFFTPPHATDEQQPALSGLEDQPHHLPFNQ
ncbi:MAG: hypothetical protein ABSE63_04780 [Thermoguttaceae bacterium]